MDTAGIGSIIVFAVGFSVLAAYIYMLRWIQSAPSEEPVSVNAEGEETPAAEAGGEEA
jgi:hypothetical protein